MRTAFFDSLNYKQKQAEIARQNWQKGLYKVLLKKKERNCINPDCKNSFTVPPSDKQKYCSKDCWYFSIRGGRVRPISQCIVCGNLITQKGASKFCSIKCQVNERYHEYIRRWQQGIEDGNRGISTQALSRHIRRYLIEKYGEKCVLCGWNKRNPLTQRVPLEVDHIDGNNSNNTEKNLRLICPNCHSLTPNFRNLNKGHGRTWRLKYIKTIATISS